MTQKPSFEKNEEFAKRLDLEDPLASFQKKFHIPLNTRGENCIYFAGNSLGLQPRGVKDAIELELEDWAKYGVEGHLHARNPWLPYHEKLTHQVATLVGAKPIEVVVMNTLTVNLHLMMVSFYRPTATRFKIIMEASAFPSDQYAVASQIRFHGFDPATSIIEVKPRPGEALLNPEDLLKTIEREGDSVALILLGNVNYLTGQAFDIEAITRAGRAKGCVVGFDLAHGAGNIPLKLHEWGPDFAIWCGYKYLNGGPGSLSGCFIHERHSKAFDLPRFSGWWGHNKQTRFHMGPVFEPIPGAEGWQLSNPPIFQLAALRVSMDLFEEATVTRLRAKSEKLTAYLEFLLNEIPSGHFTILTPQDPARRGAQLSLRVQQKPEKVLARLVQHGVICDHREPDVIRAAPVPLYNSFTDVYHFVKILEQDVK